MNIKYAMIMLALASGNVASASNWFKVTDDTDNTIVSYMDLDTVHKVDNKTGSKQVIFTVKIAHATDQTSEDGKPYNTSLFIKKSDCNQKNYSLIGYDFINKYNESVENGTYDDDEWEATDEDTVGREEVNLACKLIGY